MRIAMFSWESLHSIFHGGLGVHITELSAALERRGHEVHLITRRGENQAAYDCIDGVHYHRVEHGLSENFVESMDMMCKSMAHCFHEVTSMVGQFDVIHAHDWMCGNALKYVKEAYSTPSVFTIHSTEYGRDGNKLYDGFASWIRDTEANALHTAHTVISVSSFLAEEIQRIYHLADDKIHVIPNGVNYHDFDGYIDPAAVKGRYGIPAMAPTIACFGRMTEQKGHDMLVDAIPMILVNYPDARFVISGNGPMMEIVNSRIDALGIRPACVSLPQVPRSDYRDLMRACDIIAVPSRNEPFGIVVLEAWAAGKPVVATTAGGPRDFVWHNVNGFLVDANPGGLAHGIGSLLADHEHCRWMGTNGRNAVETEFTWDNVGGYTEGVYHYVLNMCGCGVGV